ncbi:hypothetical protein MUP29_01230, partial [bacterium]|nr:hypothetical protein [bacterium]
CRAGYLLSVIGKVEPAAVVCSFRLSQSALSQSKGVLTALVVKYRFYSNRAFPKIKGFLCELCASARDSTYRFYKNRDRFRLRYASSLRFQLRLGEAA